VQFHTLQSLYSQIPLSLLNIGLIVWLIINLVRELSFTEAFWGYLIMAAVANIVYLIYSIIGAVKARNGLFYYFLFFGKVAYTQVYRIREERPSAGMANKPPKL
jgi:uncharacterized membrane protein